MMRKVYLQPTMDTNYFIGVEPVMGIGHMKVIRRAGQGSGSFYVGSTPKTISPGEAM